MKERINGKLRVTKSGQLFVGVITKLKERSDEMSSVVFYYAACNFLSPLSGLIYYPDE